MTSHQKSIIFRREYPQLKDVIERGDDLLQHLDITYNSQRAQWRGLPGGRVVELGAVQHEKDVSKYKGRPHDLIAFDEASDFTEKQVRFLIGWNRSTDPHQRVRVLLAGNPPTSPEGEWIVRYFAPWLDGQHPNPAQPGELRWFAVLDGQDREVDGPQSFTFQGETILPKSRTFIPARLHDNPFLRDTDYGAILQGLPEPLRSQLLYGDFNVRALDNEWQVIPTAWVEAAQERGRQGKRPEVTLRCCGLDVSRGGADQTVLAKLYHEWFECVVWEGRHITDGDIAAQKVLNATLGDTPAPILVDVIGVGSSAYDSLKRHEGVSAIAVNVASASQRRDKTGKFGFANLRAEVYWAFREALDPQGPHAIALPPDRRVKVDLCSAHYSVIKTGIQVESKEDIKKRLGFSPDWGDAILLAWHGTRRGAFVV
jgi:hypothetical protein